MNKRGQIFLIAALIIVLIMAGFGVYNAVSTPKEDKRTYDLSNEIKYETNQIIDSGVYSGSEQEIMGRINQTLSYYATANPDSEIVIVYGDENTLKLGNGTNLFYTFVDTGTVSIGNGAGLDLRQRNVTEADVDVESNRIEVVLKDNSYDFNITEGQNFYLVIKTSKGGLEFVATK